MKKLILTGTLLLSVCAAFGQSGKVRSAEYLANTGGAENIEKAKADIALALENADTKNDAKTWYVAGLVYEKDVEEAQKKEALGQEFDKQQRGESVIKAYDYFVKAYELDQQPNEKGKVKPKYDKEIVSFMTTYQGELINYGFYWNDQKDYKKTLVAWEKYLDMAKLPFMQGIVPSGENDSTYIKVTYYAALIAVQDENTNKAIQYLENIKDKYNINEAYQFLAQQYLVQKDTTAYFNTIKTGFEKYPTNTFMLESLINYYLLTGKDLDGGLNYLNEAIRLNPNMAQYYYVRGNIYEVKGQQEEAVKDFNKTIELDTNNAGAHFGLGRYYYKKGELYMDRISNIRDAKIAKQETAKANDIFQQAAAEFEKCRALDPKNADNLNLLKRTYYRIYQDENNPKYKEVNNALKAL